MKMVTIEEIRSDLTLLQSKYDVLLFGSHNSGDSRPESDIDITIITKTDNRDLNIEVQKDSLENFGTKYDIRVFELYPIHIQISIIENYSVIFGDLLAISEYFYGFRKKWDDCKYRMMSNQFRSYHERLNIIERNKK